jgi:hypothetical protein
MSQRWRTSPLAQNAAAQFVFASVLDNGTPSELPLCVKFFVAVSRLLRKKTAESVAK